MAYECTEVSLRCPVQATVLGYAPNLGSGIFFTIAFGLCFLAALALGIRSRTWTFCAAVSIGSALEMLGRTNPSPNYYPPRVYGIDKEREAQRESTDRDRLHWPLPPQQEPMGPTRL